MSSNPFPFWRIKSNDNPEKIEARIALLIRLYLAQPQLQAATAILNHLNTILAAPNYITDVTQRCQYRQLAEHWRLIIWLGIPVSKPASKLQPILKMELKQLTLKNDPYENII